MMELVLGAVWALWLGVLTSISPCPLATNVAAISYISRRVSSPRQVFLTGILYTLGRTLVYLALGILLVASVFLAPDEVSRFLQKHMKMVLGPLLIVLAMFLLDLLRWNFSTGGGMSDKMQSRVDALGVWGGLFLGVIFGLSFCPISGMIFFLGLIPAAVDVNSPVAMPSLYGVGTALPALLFAVLIAGGAQAVGKVYNRLTQVEWWARRITAGILLAIGIHYSLKYIFEVMPFWDPWVQAAVEAFARFLPNVYVKSQ